MFQENIPLATKTTLGLGGAARYFATPSSIAATRNLLLWAKEHQQPVFVLGGGSNVVLADSGWPGLVVQPALTHQKGPLVGAGNPWDHFVDRCAALNLAGIECLAGIPGTVGATPIQNVGAYGQEVADTIESVTALDRETLEPHTFSNAACQFAYRQSRFNTAEQGRWLILEVLFKLRPNGSPVLAYRDLTQYFGPNAHPTLTEVVAAVRQIRAQKGMLLDPNDPDSRSAGSFFKNPILSPTQAQSLPENAPRFPQTDGSVKVPAAWLIEQAGLVKGEALSGGIGISSKHVLALVNRGGAKGADLVRAAIMVQQAVHDRWGVTLHPEPLFVGFSPDQTLPVGATRIDFHPISMI